MNGIRRAVGADAPEIRRILHSSIRELCTQDHLGLEETIQFWTRNKTEQSVLEWLTNPANVTFVSGEGAGGKLHGFVMGTWGGHILLLYVDPRHAGQGFGTRLIEVLESELKLRGVVSMTADSTKSAMAFYQRRGFVSSGRSETFGPLTSYGIEKTIA